MVKNWAAAQKESAFQSAFAVRQMEIGLVSVLSLVLGARLFGLALLHGLKYPRWIGGLAIAGGTSTVLFGSRDGHSAAFLISKWRSTCPRVRSLSRGCSPSVC
jgi:hypothetical protein